ncbi:hypothetical protein V8B97DRAFT_2025743 [Scleroderma yunnanense]
MRIIPGRLLEEAIQPRSMVTNPTPIGKSNFALDTLGLASVFGGPETIFSLTLVPVHAGRRWLGWYNSPGSYFLGQRLAQLFEYDGQKGPKLKAIHSGTVIDETGHLGALFLKECAETAVMSIRGRLTRSVDVTIVEFPYSPPDEAPVAEYLTTTCASIAALVPIAVSFTACAASGFYGDWYSFSVISLGIIANGLSYLVVGSGKLFFTHPSPASGSPRGDGFLSTPGQTILLKGHEGAVNSVTRGRFLLRFDNSILFYAIGPCATLLLLQSLVQLILIPQTSLFGQLMFVGSIFVSWTYNLWLSSVAKDRIQRSMLMGVLHSPKLTKYTLGTRTSMAVFVLLALKVDKPQEILDWFLPNETPTWQKWKSVIVDRIKTGSNLYFDGSDWKDSSDPELLEMLYRDAQSAYDGFHGSG